MWKWLKKIIIKKEYDAWVKREYEAWVKEYATKCAECENLRKRIKNMNQYTLTEWGLKSKEKKK